MRNGLKVLASISLVGLQAHPVLMNAAQAQQKVIITAPYPPPPAPCPSDAYCSSGGDGGYGYSGGGSGGGGGGYIPESEASPTPVSWFSSSAAQAKQIADGIKMVCPKPGEPYYPTYYDRAMSDCEHQVATALGSLSTQTITTGACGLQATRMKLAYDGEDTCK